MPADYKKMKMLRRSRVVWGSWALWKPRIVFWAGALAIGVISVGFARAADAAQHLFKAATAVHPLAYLLPLLLTLSPSSSAGRTETRSTWVWLTRVTESTSGKT